MIGIDGMLFNSTGDKHQGHGWLLPAAMLLPLTLGIACLPASSDGQQPTAQPTGPIASATFEQLVVHSWAIFVGNVDNIMLAKADNGQPYRTIVLNVEQTVKGDGATQIVIRTGGDGTGAGEVKFSTGERVLVLLDKGTGQYTVDGGVKGKFSIDGDNKIDGTHLPDFIAQINSILAKQRK